jgi:phosphoglucomutase
VRTRNHRPSKVVVVAAVGVVEAPGRVWFVDAICAPAATFGGERSRCSEVVAQ